MQRDEVVTCSQQRTAWHDSLATRKSIKDGSVGYGPRTASIELCYGHDRLARRFGRLTHLLARSSPVAVWHELPMGGAGEGQDSDTRPQAQGHYCHLAV